MNIEDQDGLARIVLGILERLQIPYMVTGSVASFLYGEPRVTYDVDIIVDLSSESLHTLLESLEPHAYVSREAALDALWRRQMFNAIGFETSEKVDLIVLRNRTYDRVAFERRQRKNFESLSFVVSTPEDSVLSKLSWAKRSRSEQQLRDVYGVIRKRLETLDWEYLAHWAGELGVTTLLNELRTQVEIDETRE